ncbi:hypothetical protein ACVW0P_003417 [Mucilaginibacter sp. UYNi724]
MYSEKTLHIFRQNGWFEGRRIKLDKFTHVLSGYNDEFDLTGAAASLYQELGELSFSFYNARNNRVEEIVFDVEEAVSVLFPGDIKEDYLSLTNSKVLTPIAYWNNSAGIIMADEKARIYLGVDDYFECLGQTPEEAFDKIFNSQAGQPVNQERL